LLLIARGHRSYPGVSIGEIADSSRSVITARPCWWIVVSSVACSTGEDREDRRRALVSLTERGQQVLDQITEANRRELGSLDAALFRNSLHQGLQAYRTLTDRNTIEQKAANSE
jgi:hypothetical protein